MYQEKNKIFLKNILKKLAAQKAVLNNKTALKPNNKQSQFVNVNILDINLCKACSIYKQYINANCFTCNMKASETIDYTNIDKTVTLLSQGENIFITGPAGTGKSFILSVLKQTFKDYMTLTATTGIASGNIGGTTIHSWSGIQVLQVPFPKILWKCNRYNIIRCNLLVIDEISMLSAFMLDYLDKLFKLVRKNKHPFGGIQVVFIGDFLQLPPVATNEEIKVYPTKGQYCFESKVWDELNLKTVYLSKIYRQNDIKFCNILNNFRQGCLTYNDIIEIKKRYMCPNLLENKLHLYPRKNQVSNYNKQQLDKINSPEFYYEAKDKINPILTTNSVTRKLLWKRLDKNIQAQEIVVLKKGCRVMLIKNMPEENLYNGSCGTVVDIDEKSKAVTVKFDSGNQMPLYPTIFSYYENETYIGTRYQIPLILAYAVTIHKAQGLTLDEVVVDCEAAFEHGQVYVALSRVKKLENLYILDFREHKVYADKKAQLFYKKLLESNNSEIINLQKQTTV